MLEYARVRRGLTLVRANATAMPFADGTYETVIIATGVIDFMADSRDIETVLREANRIVSGTGNVFVAFYRFSAAQRRFLASLGLLRGDTLHVRSALAMHRLGFGALVAWVAKTAGVSVFRALLLCIGAGLRSTKQERAAALATRRMIAQAGDSAALIEAAPETQPYRDKPVIGRLLEGLSVRIEDWQTSGSCHLVRVSRQETPRQSRLSSIASSAERGGPSSGAP